MSYNDVIVKITYKTKLRHKQSTFTLSDDVAKHYRKGGMVRFTFDKFGKHASAEIMEELKP